MVTKELISIIASKTGFSKRKTEELLSQTASTIGKALLDGQTVQLQNFGVIEVKERPARTIIHPKTGEKTATKSKMVATFLPATTIKEQLKNV